MVKQVTVRMGSELYRELQELKKLTGKAGWDDRAFIRWLIHHAYNKVHAKLLAETMR